MPTFSFQGLLLLLRNWPPCRPPRALLWPLVPCCPVLSRWDLDSCFTLWSLKLLSHGCYLIKILPHSLSLLWELQWFVSFILSCVQAAVNSPSRYQRACLAGNARGSWDKMSLLQWYSPGFHPPHSLTECSPHSTCFLKGSCTWQWTLWIAQQGTTDRVESYMVGSAFPEKSHQVLGQRLPNLYLRPLLILEH